ncbi:MAG: hypothetical protein AB8B73_15970 [Ekhidna sp.]
MEQFLIFTHIFCGGTVLLIGLFQMFNRKGGKNHIILGKVYVASMWWICLSALSIISFYRFSTFLMVIAVLTFYSSFVGVRVLKRKQLGTEKWYDWAVAIATSIFGIGLIVYGSTLYFNTNYTVLAFLCMFFGAFTTFSASQDLRFFIYPKGKEKKWWLYKHISAMGGSYIAAVTAFAVQNPNIFLLDGSAYQWLLWILPGVVGGPIIGRSIKKWKKKTSVG